MKINTISDSIIINDYSATPKYLQISSAIIKAIEQGELNKHELLPTINELSYTLEISRDTVEKGYKYLKSIGVINSVPGKGYYVANASFKQKLKVFLLFNKLSAHKKIIYDAFIETLGDDVSVDFYVYNNDFKLFKRFLSDQKGEYSHYVVIPHFMEGEQYAKEVIDAIPKEKLVVMDKKIEGISGKFAAVYENFEKDIYQALSQAKNELSKYHTLKIIFPEISYFPKEILNGFCRFCLHNSFSGEIVRDISTEPISSGEVYINLMEDDLVILLERLNNLQFKIGEEVGVISYNETPIKKVLLNGITTISTDFKFIGTTAANLILDNSKRHVEVPFYFTKRASL